MRVPIARIVWLSFGFPALVSWPLAIAQPAAVIAPSETESTHPARPWIRIAATQPQSRLVDYHLVNPGKVLEEVNQSLNELQRLVHRAGEAGCDVVVFPEDTLGLGTWEAANRKVVNQVLPNAVDSMLHQLGTAAAAHNMYLVCCNDTIAPDGSLRNTAFFLGRDGREIGRYDKVNMPIHELNKKRGDGFPVFETPDLGGVGMLICYDMVFPEAARCLALGGAEIIFHPTLGGAAIGDEEISRAAFRTRAVENFVYLVVSQRGHGSMIISPQGKILAEANGSDALAIADINPFEGREGGDAMNQQQDMRARLFRERSPTAFSILTDPNPPVLSEVPETMPVKEAVRIRAGVLTTGEKEFQEAEKFARQGQIRQAIQTFQQLRRKYPGSWIDRVSAERLAALRDQSSEHEVDKPSPQVPPFSATPFEVPPRTTLSNPAISFEVPDESYVVLNRPPLEVVIADNRAADNGILPGHREGYHGVASLKHTDQPLNLFVPAYAGLNFEHIHDGTAHGYDILFEPRRAPMELRVVDEHTAELYQSPTPHWGLESCSRYELLENGWIEFTFECIPRRRTWENDYLGLFWASYIHQPESLDIHFLGADREGNMQWIRGVTPKHGVQATHRAREDHRNFPHDEEFPLSLVFSFSGHRFAEPWYFGECRDMAFLQVFRPQDRVRLTQSPSGGGTGNPAWDFQWFLSEPQVGRRYQLVMRAFYGASPGKELKPWVRKVVSTLHDTEFWEERMSGAEP